MEMEGKGMEKVKEYTYLGYMLQKNGGQEAHIRKRLKRAAATMRQVWGIGKRRFGRRFGLGKKIVVVRQVDMDCIKLWSGSIGWAGNKGSRKIGKEIFEMDFGDGNTRIYDERGGAEREAERKSWKKNVDV